MLEKHTAGQDIVSYCTSRKLNRDHTIMAMDGADIAKVRCKNCGSTYKHLPRDPDFSAYRQHTPFFSPLSQR